MSRGRHIAPHRLGDAAAGRLGARERARIDRHVLGCPRCADARERIESGRVAMEEIAALPPPELGWDHIGVRVYWSTSSARHAAQRVKQRPPWRRPAVLAVGGALGLAAMAAVALFQIDGEAVDDVAVTAQPRPGAGAEVPPVPRLGSALRGIVTFASGTISLAGSAVDPEALFAHPVGPGERLATGDGRLVVQFGPESGFALAPHTTVLLRRFDEGAIELAIEDGALEVEVSHRRAGQTFSVVAGRHRVAVRGTSFQVAHRAGDLEVSCARGRVVVSDGADQVALSAGQSLSVLHEALLERVSRQAIDPVQLAALERSLARPLLPAWTESRALFETSSVVELDAPAGRAVRVDGVDVGAGSFVVRVMSGRHHVEVSDGAAGFGRGAWIDAQPGPGQRARAGGDGAVVVGNDAAPPGDSTVANSARLARRARKGQLDRALDGNSRAERCMSPLEKRDLVAGSYVVFDIGVNADGTQGHLNVVESNLPAEVGRCLRRVVDGVELPAGGATTLRYRLTF